MRCTYEMKKIPIYIIFLFITAVGFAQGEANNWFFGQFAGLQFLPDGSVAVLQGSEMNTNEGCSSISDKDGNLLFYTDGRNVWDRNSVIMPNANYNAGTGLLGDPSSTQSGIIVPKKGNPDIYYIITVDEPHHDNAATYPNRNTGVPFDEDDGFNNGLNYSIVDLSVTGSNGSIGDVTTRNVHLLTYDPTDIQQDKYKCSEKITAVKNSTGTGFWVITHFIDKFYAFLIDATGVNTTPVITQIAPTVPTSGYRRNSIGYLKASPDGKKLAIAHNQKGTLTGQVESNGGVYLYDFDDATGIISNMVTVSENTVPYGLEFSAEVKKLYVSYDRGLTGIEGVYQYDLLASNIEASGVAISSGFINSGALQLGPNKKIYRSINGGTALDVIENPEADGSLCDYRIAAVPLGPGMRSIFGLPPFITSLFSASIKAENTCFGDVTQFQLNVNGTFDSVVWDFGDGSATSVSNTPSHTYATPGTYTVVATVTKMTDVSTASADITIVPYPVANPAQNLAECDNDNDGVAAFNLDLNTADILGTQNSNNYLVRYFASAADANDNIRPLNSPYNNTTLNQQDIYARVHHKNHPECYALTTFTITALETPAVQPEEEAIVCLSTKDYIPLNAGVQGTGYTYLWSPSNETSQTIWVNEPGIYTVTITNANNCSSTKTITVKASDIAIIDDVEIRDLRDNSTVTIYASAPANTVSTYLYSIDAPNGPWQESNLFENVAPGIHTVYVYNTDECGVAEQQISVLLIPKFFTPNGDGINDSWRVIGINPFFYQQSKIRVFDRFGKLLADIDPTGTGWDGTFDGTKLPATDYWYVVELDNGRIVKGHFSLLR